MTDPHHTLAIVGLGPRGHAALEFFLRELASTGRSPIVRLVLFESSDQPGCGPVWDTSQSESNWSNVHERLLTLPARPEFRVGSTLIGGFPSYHDWANVDPDSGSDLPDVYPARRKIGTYLGERFQSLLDPLVQSGRASLVTEHVDDIRESGTGVEVITASGASFAADQVLMTVGHQPTVPDPQINGWRDEIAGFDGLQLFEAPYPVEDIVAGLPDQGRVNMAVRGFGLATIDVARATAEAVGSFTITDTKTRAQTYKPDNGIDLNIVPFTLDGMPMGPKPLTASIDARFEPPQNALDDLETHLSDPRLQAEAQDEGFLRDAICPIVATVYRSLDNKRGGTPSDSSDMQKLISDWIDDQSQTHPAFLNAQDDPAVQLRELIGMAVGENQISLDYCIGQVWRHCHPIIYAALSHSALPDAVLAKITFLDESLKRFTFGPPAESVQQIIALHDAGVLNLDFLNDPEISVSGDGWVLAHGAAEVEAPVMVDAVLAAPKIKDVTSPLVDKLLSKGVLSAVHDDLGVVTALSGFVNSEDGAPCPIAVLGRLAKGTVIGVDAILECFGDRPWDWANAAVQRVQALD